jgi:formate dehydrogenase subunit gamma
MLGRTPWDEAQARVVITRESAAPGALLPILHALQERFGYIDAAAIPAIAEALNISKAEVHGVVSFYHDFRRASVDAPVLKLCRAESCQALGCEDLVAHLEGAHGLAVDRFEAGARLAIETVYCLGNCALSPAALLDGEPIGRLDASKLDAIVAAARGGTA